MGLTEQSKLRFLRLHRWASFVIYVEKCMTKNLKKGGNVGHDPMYLCFYDHNFPYVVRHFNFTNSFGFAHARSIFNAAVVWGD